MSASLTRGAFSTSFPRIAGLMGDENIAERIQELEWFGPEFLRQMDRDLEFLGRRVTGPKVAAAYRDLLRNRDHLRDALYEIRAAAMFGTVARDFTLAPRVGLREKADVMCVLGASRIFVEVTWLKLVPVWSGVRVHVRLFVNPDAACPLPAEVVSALWEMFDRRKVLNDELQRITQLLIEQYHATRIILFGSLATERRKPGDWVHQWSDIDLAVVASTQARFSDRIGEVLKLVRPRVGLNVLVYTPGEFECTERKGGFFVRDEILARGHQLYP